jgi:Tfp pilus assembly protein PilO
MEIKPLDIVSMIGIIIVVSSSALSMHIAVKASKKQKAQQEKDAKTKKVEPNSPAANTSELRAELDDLEKRVAALEKK